VNLDVSGDPVHTRTLGLTLLWRADGSHPDACYRWRRGGALDLLRRRAGEEG
jgi:hypothetical protein